MSGTATTAPEDATVGPEAENQAEARGRRRWLLAAVLLLLVVILIAFASNTEPLTPGSGSYGVFGHDGAVTAIRPPASESAYIAPYVEGQRVTVLFPVTNEGPLPLRLLEVFPPERAVSCGWKPDTVGMRRTGAERWRPFEETTLARGETVELAVRGVFLCENPPARMDALTSYGSVPVRYAVGGLVSRTSDIDPGFSFHWTTADVELFTQDLVSDLPAADPDSFLGG